jgi:hypothetical protein
MNLRIDQNHTITKEGKLPKKILIGVACRSTNRHETVEIEYGNWIIMRYVCGCCEMEVELSNRWGVRK